jgi:phosphoglycerate kinase
VQSIIHQKARMRFETLKYFDIDQMPHGARVLMRVDANIDPLDVHPIRVTRALPDMEAILAAGGKLILMTHRGRPKGKEATLSTKHLIPRLEAILERAVVHVTEFTREACERKWKENPEAVLLLENLRFYDEEEANSRTFAKVLAALGDVYVNNAFGVCHRKHASVHKITKYIDSYAGCLLKEEVQALNMPFEAPFVFALGGIKMETKVPLLKRLAPKASAVLLGSAFVMELEKGKAMRWIQRKFKEKIHLPIDVRVEKDETISIQMVDKLKLDGARIIDIGPDTEMAYSQSILEAKSILWNGPVGITEEEEGKNGTLSIVDAMRHAKQARVVIGGGDTIELIDPDELEEHIFLSTGGGATLSFLSGERMPGLDVLRK